MARRLPILSITNEAGSIPVTHVETILIADTIEDFSVDFLRLLDSPDLKSKLTSQALEMLVREHSLNIVSATLFDLCSKTCLLEET